VPVVVHRHNGTSRSRECDKGGGIIKHQPASTSAATWQIFIVIPESRSLISASSAASPTTLNFPRLSLFSEHPLERESAMLSTKAMPTGRGSNPGNVLSFSRPPNRERTLETHCDNCHARFIAWYGAEEDVDTDTIDVEKCGLCGGDPINRDNFKDAVLRLICAGDHAKCQTRIDRSLSVLSVRRHAAPQVTALLFFRREYPCHTLTASECNIMWNLPFFRTEETESCIART
jgi:hypothetical protein